VDLHLDLLGGATRPRRSAWHQAAALTAAFVSRKLPLLEAHPGAALAAVHFLRPGVHGGERGLGHLHRRHGPHGHLHRPGEQPNAPCLALSFELHGPLRAVTHRLTCWRLLLTHEQHGLAVPGSCAAARSARSRPPCLTPRTASPRPAGARKGPHPGAGRRRPVHGCALLGCCGKLHGKLREATWDAACGAARQGRRTRGVGQRHGMLRRPMKPPPHSSP
jgi:hypothetical protein